MRIRKGAAAAAKTAAGVSVGREVIEWAVTIALAVGLALCVHTWVGQIITVSGPSMQPGLHTGERVLVGRVEYYFSKPKRGDIVIVKFPDRTDDIIKRVIATAGETISISGGSVYIDGKKLDEPYILDPIVGDMAPQKVPEGTVFVMGDNRNDSHDSRAVGPVPLNQVLGRAYNIIWPVGNWEKISGYKGSIEQ